MVTLLLLCLFSIALADDYVYKPKPCCFPKLFSAVMNENGAQQLTGMSSPEAIDTMVNIYADFTTYIMRVDSNYTKLDGTRDEFTSILDFNTMKNYYMTGPNCYITKISGPPINSTCIPANAVYGGRRVIGSYASNVHIDSWRFTVGNVTENVSVTTEGCIPVLQATTDLTDPEPYQRILTFTNVTLGVPSDIHFDHPSDCVEV